jgi:hypothetical protein
MAFGAELPPAAIRIWTASNSLLPLVGANESLGVPGMNLAGFPRAVAHALKSELGSTHQAVKIIPKWTGATKRTVDFPVVIEKGAPNIRH